MGPPEAAGRNSQSDAQGQLSREMWDMQKPVAGQAGNLAEFMLNSGKLPSQFLPFVGKAMEGNKMNVSRAQQATQDSLGRSRMAGTPFGQRILGDQRLAGEMQIGQLYGNLFFPLLNQLMATSQGAAGQAMQGMSSASQAEASRIAAQTQQQGQYSTALMQGTMGMAQKMMPTSSFGFSGAI